MDPISVLKIAIQVGTMAFNAAKNAGLVGSPDWAKYADSGMSALKKGTEIADEIKAGSTKYDSLTADEIETLLKAASWEDLEGRAKEESGN